MRSVPFSLLNLFGGSQRCSQPDVEHDFYDMVTIKTTNHRRNSFACGDLDYQEQRYRGRDWVIRYRNLVSEYNALIFDARSLVL
jgi:hypothetical protein